MKRFGAIALVSLAIGMAQARTASAAPIVAVAEFGLNGAGQFFADFLIEDPSGLDLVDIFTVSNLTTSLPPGQSFFFGTIDDLILRATVIDPAVTAEIGISALNTVGAETRATFVLDPVRRSVDEAATVPEPATVALLAVALLGVAARRPRTRPNRAASCDALTPAQRSGFDIAAVSAQRPRPADRASRS